MKMTVITDADGTLVAAARVMGPDPKTGLRAGLMAGPGQQARELDVPDLWSSCTSAQELHDQLCAHLAQHHAKG